MLYIAIFWGKVVDWLFGIMLAVYSLVTEERKYSLCVSYFYSCFVTGNYN